MIRSVFEFLNYKLFLEMYTRLKFLCQRLKDRSGIFRYFKIMHIVLVSTVLLLTVYFPCHMFIGASVGNVRWSSLSSTKNADAAWR